MGGTNQGNVPLKHVLIVTHYSTNSMVGTNQGNCVWVNPMVYRKYN